MNTWWFHIQIAGDDFILERRRAGRLLLSRSRQGPGPVPTWSVEEFDLLTAADATACFVELRTRLERQHRAQEQGEPLPDTETVDGYLEQVRELARLLADVRRMEEVL